MKLYLKHLLIVLLLTLLPFLSYSQNFVSNPLSEIIGNIDKKNDEYPQQKVYLHTDKDEYVAGETLWLKAYIVNATTHLQDTISNNLNVELVNIKGDPVSVKLLSVDEGISHAEIQLPDSLSGGNYKIRAYTDWMMNFDSDLFFKKEMYVHNPIEENFIPIFFDIFRNRWFNRQLENKAEEMQFAFFPEGGNLVQGLENRVAFKATNSLGAGKEATGRLLDNEGNLIQELESIHNGMGVFSFTPEKDKTYTTKVKYSNGQEKSVDLPDVLNEGYTLTTNVVDDKINVEVKSNFNPDEHILGSDIYIMAQVRGKPYYTKKATIENGDFQTTIPTDKLPAGVGHITLFDVNATPLAERLVFVNNKNIDQPKVNIEETEIDNKKGLSTELLFESIKHENTQGNYSISVVGSNKPVNKPIKNIATYFLLTSDIGKTLEDTWFYFSEPIPEKEIDLVMMTHGWRRFDWNAVIAKDFPEITHETDTGLTLRGKVSAVASDRRVEEQHLELAITKENEPLETYSTKTDNDGYFSFPGLDYKGQFAAELTVQRDRRRRTLDVQLQPKEFYTKDFSKSFLTRPRKVTSRGDDWERASRPKTMAEKSKPFDPDEKETSMYGTPDQVVYLEDIDHTYTNMMQLLRSHVRGLRIERGIITLRGISSIEGGNEPLFLVDGSSVHRNSFLSLNPNDIDRIEVFTGPSTAMFGIRGTNGVLIAYTKRAASGRQAFASYLLEGYTIPSDFYQAKIDIEKNYQTNTPRTIFWKPNLIPDNNGQATIEFPIEHDWNNISIIVEGIDQKGNITFKKLDLQ